MKTVIKLSRLTHGLNGSKGLMRSHHFGRGVKKLKDSLQFEIRRNRPGKHPGPVRITYYRFCKRWMDWDNACASFKHIGDALKLEGVIKDDNPGVVVEFIPRQFPIKTKEEESTIIVIEDLDIEEVQRIFEERSKMFCEINNEKIRN